MKKLTKKQKAEKKIASLKAALKHVKDIAKLLTPEVWTQGSYGFEEGGSVGNEYDAGQYCLMGASFRVDGPAEKLAQRYMKEEAQTYTFGFEGVEIKVMSVEDFNDEVAVSVEDVQAFLKKTAKRIRADINELED